MAYVARPDDFQANHEVRRPDPPAPAQPQANQPHRGPLRRLFDALMEGRQRRVQREIDFYVATRGHKMTDELEREISSLILGGNRNVRR